MLVAAAVFFTGSFILGGMDILRKEIRSLKGEEKKEAIASTKAVAQEKTGAKEAEITPEMIARLPKPPEIKGLSALHKPYQKK